MYAFVLSAVAAIALLAASASPALAGDHVFDVSLSLIGGTGTSKIDPVPDPGSLHPPKPFSIPCGVAVDPLGYVYVASQGEVVEGELLNGRIDIFNPAGEFILEIENDLQPCDPAVDAAGNIYLVQRKSGPEDGVVRYSPSAYPPTPSVSYGSPVALVPDIRGQVAVDQQTGHLFVPALDHVEEYSAAAEGNALLRADIGEGLLKQSQTIAVDSSTGDILVSSLCPGCPLIPTQAQPFVSVVYVFESSGAVRTVIDGSDTPDGGFRAAFAELNPAIDEKGGEVFVDDVNGSGRVYRFVSDGDSYKYLFDPELEDHPAYQPFTKVAVSNGAGSPTTGNVYVSSSSSPPRLLVFTPEGEVTAPVVSGTTFTDATLSDVTLRAEIDPQGAATEYRFEYVDEATYLDDVEEQGPGHGFDHALQTDPASLPVGNQPVPVAAGVAGLTPDTAYRFRVVATNHCKPKEPEVVCSTAGEEAAFATYSPALAQGPCPNEALRTGYSAALPDCRAFELVTPPDTNGRDPNAAFISGFDTELASGDGNDLLFMIYGGTLGGSLGGNGVIDGYRAIRGSHGWETRLAGPAGAQSQSPSAGGASSDHGYWFWRTGAESDDGSLVINEESTSYVLQPGGDFRLVGEGPLGSDPRAQGFAIGPGGSHLVFSSNQPLAAGASPAGVTSIYDRTEDGETHVVSLKPDGQAPPLGASVFYEGATPGGAAVAFTVLEAGVPTLYVRLDNATTVSAATGPLDFAGLSADGDKLTYSKGGNLFSFDTSSETTSPIGSGGSSVPVNVSADGSHVYFVSTKVIGSGGGQGPGKQNLYVWNDETKSVGFIAQLTMQDVEGTEFKEAFIGYGLGLWLNGVGSSQSSLDGLGIDPSRTTPDGEAIVFESRAELTAYDNAGHAQVYRYEKGEEPPLTCLSCNPTLARASGDARLQVLRISDEQAPSHSSAPVRNISDDGRTVFFQSPEPLAVADVDAVDDVYKWQEQGVGGCTRPAGCVSLISSGQSEADNYLFAATPSGNDVFFTTPDLLTEADGDTTVSVYDARVLGGFAEQAETPCAGEACKEQPAPPPNLAIPSSPGLGSSGNVKPGKRCGKNQRKVRRKGKVRCVLKHGRNRRGNGDRGGRR